MKIWFFKISIKVSFYIENITSVYFLKKSLNLKILHKHEPNHPTMVQKSIMSVNIYEQKLIEIKTRELTEPTANQIQKPNFKNQQLEARHIFTTNQI